jgi:hypothetical protein
MIRRDTAIARVLEMMESSIAMSASNALGRERQFVALLSGLFVTLTSCGASRAAAVGTPAPAPGVDPASVSRLWKPGRYGQIEIGKTSIRQVIQALGAPIWHGEPEAEPGEGRPLATEMYEFEKAPTENARLTVLVDKETSVVKAVTLEFSVATSEAALVRKYGQPFARLDTRLGPCPTHREIQRAGKLLDDSSAYPMALVYPQLGMYFSIGENREVVEQSFMRSCPLK